MSVTGHRHSSVSPPASDGDPIYEACDHCSAAVDSNQRYCVACGTRRQHVYDPAARFLSEATSRARSASRPGPSTSIGKRRSFSLATAAVLVAIPLAVAVGVLVGQAGSSSDSKLLTALKAQQPTVVNVGGGAASASPVASHATTASTTLSSDFTLQRGFAIQLQTIAGAGATQARVSAAEQRERTRGAGAVGLITPADFTITPRPPAGDDVIYSGQYKTRSAADAALAKLKGKFPAAKVIAVRLGAVAAVSGKVLAKSNYGTAHQVTGFKPTSSQLATGARVAAKTAKEINSNYVQSQKGLPDQVSVP